MMVFLKHIQISGLKKLFTCPRRLRWPQTMPYFAENGSYGLLISHFLKAAHKSAHIATLTLSFRFYIRQNHSVCQHFPEFISQCRTDFDSEVVNSEALIVVDFCISQNITPLNEVIKHKSTALFFHWFIASQAIESVHTLSFGKMHMPLPPLYL